MGRKLDPLDIDYDSVRAKLVSFLQDFNLIKDLHKSSTGVIIIELLAYITELLNFYINETRNEMSVPLAQKRDTLISLAKSFGYELFYGAPARGDVYIEWTHADLAAGNKVIIPRFTYLKSRQGVNFMTIEDYSWEENVISGAAYMRIRQGILRTTTLGNSDGQSFQKFRVPSRFVTIPTSYDKPLVDVVFDVHATPPAGGTSVEWSYKQSFISSNDTDTHFSIEHDDENYIWITFGDGIFGKIPEAGAEINIDYEEHVGTYANIDGPDLDEFNVNQLSIYNETIPVEAAMLSAADFTNGRDPDDNETLRKNIPKFTRIQGRAVSPADFQDAYELHKGVIQSQIIGFNELFNIVSRQYTLTGTAADISPFLSPDNSFLDLSATYDRPWQYIAASGALSADKPSAFESGAISAFGIQQTDIWAYNGMGANLIYQPDYHTLVCGSVALGAPSASPISAWFGKVIWSNDLIGASAAGWPSGALTQSVINQLLDWIDSVAQPMINTNILQQIPQWIFINLSLNIEKDPKFYGAEATIIDDIKELMWNNWGFNAVCTHGNYRVDFGTKTYLNHIENEILNNIDGVLSINIAGKPDYMLQVTASGYDDITSGGQGFAMWTSDMSGNMYQVAAQEYWGNAVTGTPATFQSGAVYTSAYGVFWNPDERALKFKDNQLPIFNISGINFT